jgi:hypothetical protein
MASSPRALATGAARGGGGGDALREAEHAERQLRALSSASWGGDAGAGAAEATAALKAGLDAIARGGNGAEPAAAARLTDRVLATLAAGTEREAKEPARAFDPTAFMAVAAPAASRGESSGDARSPPRAVGGMEEDESEGEGRGRGGSEEGEMGEDEDGYSDEGEEGEEGEDGDEDEDVYQDGDEWNGMWCFRSYPSTR